MIGTYNRPGSTLIVGDISYQHGDSLEGCDPDTYEALKEAGMVIEPPQPIEPEDATLAIGEETFPVASMTLSSGEPE